MDGYGTFHNCPVAIAIPFGVLSGRSLKNSTRRLFELSDRPIRPKANNADTSRRLERRVELKADKELLEDLERVTLTSHSPSMSRSGAGCFYFLTKPDGDRPE